MLRWFKGDLHIHTALSPCAEGDMLPGKVVERAAGLGIGLLAITDHNSAGNVRAFMEKGRRSGISVIPGMEIQSREEVHILALLRGIDEMEELGRVVRAHLPQKKNSVRFFGHQSLVDSDDNIICEEEQLLLTSTDLSLHELVAEIHRKDGIAIASHVDRPSFSLLVQLGLIPSDLSLDALEVSRDGAELICKLMAGGSGNSEMGPKEKVIMEGLKTALKMELPLICSSDAHRIEEIGKGITYFLMNTPTFEEVKLAIAGAEGRSIKFRMGICCPADTDRIKGGTCIYARP